MRIGSETVAAIAITLIVTGLMPATSLKTRLSGAEDVDN